MKPETEALREEVNKVRGEMCRMVKRISVSNQQDLSDAQDCMNLLSRAKSEIEHDLEDIYQAMRDLEMKIQTFEISQKPISFEDL